MATKKKSGKEKKPFFFKRWMTALSNVMDRWLFQFEGDKGETMAIKRALGEDVARKVEISSTKSMLGHMLGAAGAVELIICALAIKNGILPPTIGYKEPDPACDLDYIPNTARKSQVDITLSNSFGFGGQNACVALRRVK